MTLLTVTSKLLGRFIVNRIKNAVDEKLRKEQAGFRQGRGTTEQNFVLRNILEQVCEWRSSLYVHFVDFEKAFDSVHRSSLWTIMKAYGIPDKIIDIVKAMCENFECP